MAGKTMGGWSDVTSYGRNEIVFEGRNKDYGAYLVRRRYRSIILLAFGISVGVAVVGISMPVILRILSMAKKSGEMTKNITVHLTPPPVTPPKTPPPKPPPPPPPPKQLVKQLRVTPPQVVHHVLDTIPPPPVHAINNTNVGTQNVKGKDTTILQPITTNSVIGDASANQIFTVVQQMPQFSGGDIYKYLGDHINYPEMEKEAGITGIVYVTFVVEKDGSITGVKVLRGVPGGPGLDKEAVRVISGMPKWSPGMQNGHAVRVQYNIPIHFELR